MTVNEFAGVPTLALPFSIYTFEASQSLSLSSLQPLLQDLKPLNVERPGPSVLPFPSSSVQLRSLLAFLGVPLVGTSLPTAQAPPNTDF